MRGRGAQGGRQTPLLPFEAAAPAPTAAPRREFLGWDRPVLHSAARWILAELGPELGDVLVALPGARAVQRLRELLARSAPPLWTPPRVLTQGELVDELVRLERPAAERALRTLAWERSLAGLSDEERRHLHRPRATDEPGLLRERLRLAETVRALHGELAPEGRDFAELARGAARTGLEAEAERWATLARAQQRYRALLEELGCADPHEGRAAAIAAGRVDRSRRVVLVGVADMNHLLARALGACPERVTALVAAPPSLAGGFDELGRLRTEAWKERDLPLPLERWRVAEKPVDQAQCVREVLEEWRGELSAEELVLGVADEAVVPYLERALDELGTRARTAAGTPVERTRAVRLLRALEAYLRHGGFAELAALARDPDLAPALFRDGDPAERLDAYFVEHLPRDGRGSWVEDSKLAPAVRAFQERLEESLGALARRERAPLRAWAAPIRTWLAEVYPGALDPGNELERVLAESLQAIGRALAELEEVPDALGLPELHPADALELLLRSLLGQRVPPPPRAHPAGPPAVELVGWLDLALDDAPALVVTGFNEGRVPQSPQSIGGGHAFLPDSARRALGLPGDDQRLARDVYAATVILETRARCVLVTARRSAEGDPLVPSRLAFHRPAEEIPERVRRFLPREDGRTRVHDEGPETARSLPRLEGARAREPMSVSSFGAYLQSPYGFYLERVLGLRSIDDRTHELDPLGFGALAHAVLEDFGREGPCDSSDALAIAAFLAARLRARAAARFGPRPLPAVLLQVEQLEHRLRIFARRQAERVLEGWRIRAVEWQPETPAVLEVDGRALRLSARIDRIDVHPDGRWAVLDYKTGESAKTPEKAHRLRDGSWIDLQLPLYRVIARALALPGEPGLGYVRLGKDEEEIDFAMAGWKPEELDGALEQAREVVRRVRAGEFWELGVRLPQDEILRAICGESTLGFGGGEAAE